MVGGGLEELITAEAFVITAVIKSTPLLPQPRGHPEQPHSCWGGGRQPVGAGIMHKGYAEPLTASQGARGAWPSSLSIPPPSRDILAQTAFPGRLPLAPKAAPDGVAAGTALCCSPRCMQFSRSVPWLSRVPLPGLASFLPLETPCVP